MNVLGLEISVQVIGLIIIVVCGVILYNIFGLILHNVLNVRAKKIKLAERKQKTIQALFRNILKYSMLIIALMLILGLIGIDRAAIVASIGVFGIVIGLAFQDILKDILSGIFILFEDKYAVGDVIEVCGFRGEVISLGIKTTKMRNFLGETKIISNRNIDEVTNYSLADSLAIIDVMVAYDSDVDHVEKVLINVANKLSKTIDDLTDDFTLLGVQEIGYYITFRITVKTKPMKHFAVKREALKVIKKELDKNNIKRR